MYVISATRTEIHRVESVIDLEDIRYPVVALRRRNNFTLVIILCLPVIIRFTIVAIVYIYTEPKDSKTLYANVPLTAF